MKKIHKSAYVRPLDFQHGRVEMVHGAGGRAAVQLLESLFLPAFENIYLRQGNDAAVLPSANDGARLVMATDAHVVSPLFFPGGDIGSLSIHGTINDLAMLAAQPLWIAVSFVLEEGFPLADLRRIVDSMAQAAQAAGVSIVTGDTKVVERGKADGVYITTTGVGYQRANSTPAGNRARAGDAILLSGSIAEHGMAIMSQRAGLQFESGIQSDSAALHELVAVMQETGVDIHVLRDPTRGGLANTLHEIAQQSVVGMQLDEASIPVQANVAAACEFLGLDPLYVANEGKLLAICAAADAAKLLAAMQCHPLGKSSTQIGYVLDDTACFVQMSTQMGGQRMVDWLNGEQLPRIC